jgi:nitrogen regulatory protein PII
VTGPLVHLIVLVKPFKAAAVLAAAAAFGATAGTVREAKGFGRQKGYLDRYRGGDFDGAYLPKVEIGVWVAADRATDLADHLARTARTGRIGDGKIFAVRCVGAVEF